MSNIGLVMTTSIRNYLRLKTALFIMATVTIICVAGVALIFCILLLEPEIEKAAPDRSLLESYMGIVVYATSFIVVGITLSSFAFQSLVREKTRGNLQALLATPFRASDIWIGKSLSIFLPGAALGIVTAVLVLIILNAVYTLPETGFLFNIWIVISSFIAVPLIYLALGLLVHLIGLTSKAANGNLLAQMFLPVMINVMIQLTVRNVVAAGSWLFAVMNIGLAVVIGIIVLSVRSKLTPENIILSN